MRKRRNYKKVLIAVISAVLCLITAFGLTACGKKDGSDGDGGTKVSDKEWQKRLSWEDCESYTYETWNNITEYSAKLKSDPSVSVAYSVNGIDKIDLKNNKSCDMIEYVFKDETIDIYDTELADRPNDYIKVSDGVYRSIVSYEAKVGDLWYEISRKYDNDGKFTGWQGEVQGSHTDVGKLQTETLSMYKTLRSMYTYDKETGMYTMNIEGTNFMKISFPSAGGVIIVSGTGDEAVAYQYYHSKNATTVTLPEWEIKTES